MEELQAPWHCLLESKTGRRLVAEDDEPNPDRAGLVVMEEGRPFAHYCVTCGRWGAFGYDVDVLKGRLGRWYCNEHRPDRK